MNQIEIKTPVVINGVIVTEDVLIAIDMMQFGGAYGRQISSKEFDPSLLQKYATDCKELSFYLLKKAIDNDQKTIDTEEMEVFGKIHWFYSLLNYFNLPENLIEKLKMKKLLTEPEK